MLYYMIFSKLWFYSLILKFLWYKLDIHGNVFVKFHDIWMCVDSPFVF